MAPSAPEPSSTMAPTAEITAAEMQAELQYLRLRNEELQSQLDKLSRADANSAEEDDKDLLPSSSSSLDSGLNLKEKNRGNKIDTPLDLVRSSSTSLDGNGNAHSGLHHRRVSGKENTDRSDIHPAPQSSSPSRHRGSVKAKVSDLDITHTTGRNGSLDPTSPKAKRKLIDADGEIRSSTESGFENESENRRIFQGKGTRKTSDGGGRYFKALSIEGDEEEGRFPDIHISNSSSSELEGDESEEDDNLIDDDSHNKHVPRMATGSTLSGSVDSASSTLFPPFKDQIKERAGWLIGLLFLQSCSSFIIQYNQTFLQSHMVIVQFLTMLVGAGGNAGNQASVRVIRSLALGTLNQHTMRRFLVNESKIALCLSALIGMTGFIRAAMFSTPPGETIAVTTSVCAIVAISVAIGSTLPLAMKKVGIDPAHSSTTIQVVMDILGVLITVCVSSFVLSFKIFQNEDTGGEDGSADSLL